MSLIQRFVMKFLPKSWSEWMKAESMKWQLRCTTCGLSTSVWDAGGIRAGASSKGKVSMMYCRNCGTLRGHAVEPIGGAFNTAT